MRGDKKELLLVFCARGVTTTSIFRKFGGYCGLSDCVRSGLIEIEQDYMLGAKTSKFYRTTSKGAEWVFARRAAKNSEEK